MKREFRVTVLISGRGSNLESLIKNARNYAISTIISDREDAPGLTFGEVYKIETMVRERKRYPSLKECKEAIYKAVRESSPDLIALAGFMQVVEPSFVKAFYGQLVNIHPSLLPKFPGLHTHQHALEAGEREHGCTVHFVDEGVDTGPIIAQAKLRVEQGDSEESLAERVLAREHALYPWVINSIAKGTISLSGRRVEIAPEAVSEGKQLGFHLERHL